MIIYKLNVCDNYLCEICNFDPAKSAAAKEKMCFRFEVLALMSSLRENFKFSAKDFFYLILLYRIDCLFTLSSFNFIAKKRVISSAIKQTGGD